MRIAFLCKRRYMNKDVILDRYARLYEIPFQLACLGHDVRAFCLSYSNHAQEGPWLHDAGPGHLEWESTSPGRTYLPALLRYPFKLLRQLREFAPDVMIGASDIPHVVLGHWLAKRLRVPFVADLYDNYEGFGQARIPGMIPALRRAVRDADMVTTTSEPLRELIVHEYRARGTVIAMPSTVDKSVFYPRDRAACRIGLGLPVDARLIGTAGGLYRDKGILALYDAWQSMENTHPDLHLVLAGPHEADTPPPTGPRVHYLGALPHARIAELFGALDVGVICILDTPFGRYCFPQKAYEMLACNLPVVAANVGAMQSLLAHTPHALYPPGDSAALARNIAALLHRPAVPDVLIDDWRTIIAELERRLLALLD